MKYTLNSVEKKCINVSNGYARSNATKLAIINTQHIQERKIKATGQLINVILILQAN